MPVFHIPLVMEEGELWFWEGQDWRNFLTDEFLPQFQVTFGWQCATTKKGTPYETFALYVLVVPEDVKDAHWALMSIAREQLRRASERSTVVLRAWPTTEKLDGGMPDDVRVRVRVYMRYALEDKHDG